MTKKVFPKNIALLVCFLAIMLILVPAAAAETDAEAAEIVEATETDTEAAEITEAEAAEAEAAEIVEKINEEEHEVAKYTGETFNGLSVVSQEWLNLYAPGAYAAPGTYPGFNVETENGYRYIPYCLLD